MTTCLGNCCSPGCRLWCLWWCLFVLSFFPRGVLDEILNLIESVSEDFPSYFCIKQIHRKILKSYSEPLAPDAWNLDGKYCPRLSWLKPMQTQIEFLEHIQFKQWQTDWHPFRVVLGWTYRGLTGGFLLLQNFSVAISVSPHVCFILVLILISIFLR